MKMLPSTVIALSILFSQSCGVATNKGKTNQELKILQAKSLKGDYAAMRSLYIEYEISGDDENYKKWFAYAISRHEPLAIRDKTSEIEIDIEKKCEYVKVFFEKNKKLTLKSKKVQDFYKFCIS